MTTINKASALCKAQITLFYLKNQQNVYRIKYILPYPLLKY
jgi:hypothetical protein